MSRIYLSAPDMGIEERQLLLDAFDSNWIAPTGPHVDAFEKEFRDAIGVPYATALSSGSAALHLALLVLGVGPGDDVIVSDFTFAASVNAIAYVGARPILIDCDALTWSMDPHLLQEELAERSRKGRIPKAAIIVDLYGQCADYRPLLSTCEAYGIPVIEDAAEALGASYGDAHAGALGTLGVFSFNGNKIISTSGGGMLVSSDDHLVDRARYLSTQAREPVIHYEHRAVGYNYRMSNLLAAIGRGQLRQLATKVRRRRSIYDYYHSRLEGFEGVGFMPEAQYGIANRWLTCITIDPAKFGASRDDLILALEEQDIESRPTWKPMHLQPVFAHLPFRGAGVSAHLFEIGLCLPSGSSLEEGDLDRVIRVIESVRQASGRKNSST